VSSTVEHAREYGVYIWDTFDDACALIYEGDSLVECQEWAEAKHGPLAYGTTRNGVLVGAVLEIVNQRGRIIRQYTMEGH
jgi:hypothetical protein